MKTKKLTSFLFRTLLLVTTETAMIINRNMEVPMIMMSITDWKKRTSYLTFYTPWFFYPTITKKCFEFPVKLSGACFIRKNKVTPQLHNWAEPKTTLKTTSLTASFPIGLGELGRDVNR